MSGRRRECGKSCGSLFLGLENSTMGIHFLSADQNQFSTKNAENGSASTK